MSITIGNYYYFNNFSYQNAYTQNASNLVNPLSNKVNQQNSITLNESVPDISAAKRTGSIECKTCKERKYQDSSDDPGVSFKSAAHIDPGSSGAVVMAHEQEHVSNERAKASAENRKIVSQSVSLQTAVCPECGRVYVAGGTTRTVTKSDNSGDNKDFFKDNFNSLMSKHFGKSIDVKV